MININLLIPYTIMHCSKKYLVKKRKGHIITIGSVAGLKYSPNYSMYSATKFALRALTEAFRNEIQSFNVKTSLIQPGFIETKFWDTFGENDSKFQYDKKIAVSASNIADTIDFCLSSSGKFTLNEIICRSIHQER